MLNMLPFRRYEENGVVTYEMLSSKGNCYYTVELVNGKQATCQCKRREFHPTCSHGDHAEKEEMIYQASQQALAWATTSTLNDSNKGFNLLRV